MIDQNTTSVLWRVATCHRRPRRLVVLCSCRGCSCAGSTRNSNFSVTPIFVHPTMPPAAGVSDDRRLIVRNAQHELTGIARVDASVRRGAVSVPRGHAGANVNLLTSKDDIDLVTGMTRYSAVPVSLHPA